MPREVPSTTTTTSRRGGGRCCRQVQVRVRESLFRHDPSLAPYRRAGKIPSVAAVGRLGWVGVRGGHGQRPSRLLAAASAWVVPGPLPQGSGGGRTRGAGTTRPPLPR